MRFAQIGLGIVALILSAFVLSVPGVTLITIALFLAAV